jgi:hypothetical protein
MRHARPDYDVIQDTPAAWQLAYMVLEGDTPGERGVAMRQLARDVLGIEANEALPAKVPLTTNETTRLIPRDEPVFLIRGQDTVGGKAVLAWVELARAAGAGEDILEMARLHAARMESWQPKKVPDAKPGVKPAAPSARPPQAPPEAPTGRADVTRLNAIATSRGDDMALLCYALESGVQIDDIGRDGFWEPVKGALNPGDVIFVRARLPDGSVTVLERVVAEVEPIVRVRKVR